jgi:hypothetical protein
LLDGFLKYNQAVNLNPAPSVEDLRKDVVTRIAANVSAPMPANGKGKNIRFKGKQRIWKDLKIN